jgi:hypothetical protein
MDQKKRVSIEGGWNAEFSSVVPGVWDQRQDWLQMARKVSRQGLEGMEEDSRRPRSSPKQLSEGQVCEMVKLKLVHRHWGPRKIRTLYHRRHGQSPSESSFKRVLEQVGLTQPRRVREGPHNRLFPGPACCCDVVYLCQAFSQPTGPGRLWISLGAILLPDIQVVDDRTKT